MAVPGQAAVAEPRRRIAVVCEAGAPLRHLRGLMSEVVARGHTLLTAASGIDAADRVLLDAVGAEHFSFAAEPASFKLIGDWKSIAGVKTLLADWQPDVVLAYGAQTMVYGALAAKAVDAGRVVLLIDGLPEKRFAGQLGVGEMPAWRYGQALRACHHAVFHSHADVALLRKLAVVPHELPISVLPGAGVDLDGVQARSLPSLAGGLVFLMVASLDDRGGVREYCQAAALVRKRAPNTRILLAGLGQGRAGVIAKAELAACEDIEFFEDVERHPRLIDACHVFVYPAVADGTPQPVLDAMAAGRPVIAANVPGSRAAVDERVNGCLTAPRDAAALAEAMESFLKRPDLIPSMARASRAKAERFASAASVRQHMLQILGAVETVAA